MMPHALLLGLAAASAPQVNSLVVDRTPVAFACTCKDILSTRFATEMRNLLARSPRFREVALTAKEHDGRTPAYLWRISLVTMVASGAETDPNSIAVSIVITFDGSFMSQAVEMCGKDRLEDCANDILADFDSDVHDSK